MALSRFWALTFIILCGTALSGCETAKGVQTDVSSGYTSVKTALAKFRPFDQPATAPATADQGTQSTIASAAKPAAAPALASTSGHCPEVRIVPDLNQVHQFVDPSAMVTEQSVSSIHLAGVQSACSIAQNKPAIDMTLAFEGSTGPKARAKPNDKPRFAYPYFVALTNQQGNIISKEIFAVTMAYDNDENKLNHTETIRQLLPTTGADQKDYKILIGFQLTDQELAYNRAMPSSSTMAIMPVAVEASAIEPAAGAPLILSPIP